MTPEPMRDDSESEEEKDWRQLSTAQFFNGYAESDAIYDRLAGEGESAAPAVKD
jgi:hypothetical protein